MTIRMTALPFYYMGTQEYTALGTYQRPGQQVAPVRKACALCCSPKDPQYTTGWEPTAVTWHGIWTHSWI